MRILTKPLLARAFLVMTATLSACAMPSPEPDVRDVPSTPMDVRDSGDQGMTDVVVIDIRDVSVPPDVLTDTSMTDGCTRNAFEVCDGIDNDCDGMIDENLGTQSCGVGACRRTISLCMNGTVQVCSPGPMSSEVCDGADNDCDGQTDEDQPSITCGMGECQVTVSSCFNGATQTCMQAMARLEVCDGRDNNCNGQTDEGIAMQMCGQGICVRTAPGCTNGVVPTCTPGTPAMNETCNNMDDNCNGTTDEGLPDRTCGTGACVNTVPGCINGSVPVCTPLPGSAEVCDLRDNDCNGATDDNIPNQMCGLGQCRISVSGCMSGRVPTCTPPSGMLEICNGSDDDCDGMTDETLTQSCYAGPTGTQNVGICRAGVSTCTNGTFQGCAGQVLPGIEQCNNMDDNCNGTTDEGISSSCYTGTAGTLGIGRCVAGTRTCVGGVPGACMGEVVPGTETCNNVDDNCNGTTDEGLSQTCYTGPTGTQGIGACRGGTSVCVMGSFGACMGQTVPTSETCNNVDDNCNGSTDESVTRTCYTGPTGTQDVGACRGGTQTCSAGTFGACTGQIVPATETCNMIDDNCNGMTDEGVAGCGAPANDSCASATPLDLTNNMLLVAGDTTTATPSLSSSCACTSGNDVFYSFTLTQTEYVSVDTYGLATWDTGLYFLSDTCVALPTRTAPELVCDDDNGACSETGRQSHIFAILAPGSYRVGVSGCASGAFQIRFAHYPVGANGSRGVLPVGTSTQTGTLTSGAGNVMQCSAVKGGGKEQSFYFLTCPSYAGGTMSAATCATAPSFDTVVSVRHSNAAEACDDDTCGSLLSNVTNAPVPAGGGFHLVYVDAYSATTITTSNNYSLAVTRP